MSTEHGTRLRQRAALIKSAALALACILVAAGWAANRSVRQGTPSPNAKRAGHAVASARTAAIARPPEAQAPAASVWRYDSVVKRNLFMPPVTRASQEASALAPLAPMPIDAFTQINLEDMSTESASPEAEVPQWVYAGYVTVDGNPVAIVENSSTKTAEFLQVGQTLGEFVVTEVKPEAVQLTRAGESKTLPISDAFTATPLNEPPRPQGQSTRDQGGRWRRGFPGGDVPGGGFRGGGSRGDFFRRVLPALRDNPEFADQARRFLEGLAGPEQPSAASPPMPGDEPPPQGGTP